MSYEIVTKQVYHDENAREYTCDLCRKKEVTNYYSTAPEGWYTVYKSYQGGVDSSEEKDFCSPECIKDYYRNAD